MNENERLIYFRKAIINNDFDEEFIFLAKEVLEDQTSSATLKKLSAKGLLAINYEFSTDEMKEASIYSAYLEMIDDQTFMEQLIEYLNRIKREDSLDEDGLIILTTFVRRASKSKDIPIEIGRKLLFQTMVFVEGGGEDLSHLLKSSLKIITRTQDERIELFESLYKELPPGFEAKYYALSYLISLISSLNIDLNKDQLYQELLYCAESQSCCSASSPLIISLIPIYPELIEGILRDCLLNSHSIIRINTIRSWIARIISYKINHQFLKNLTNDLEEIVHGELNEDLWPPSSLSELENVTCMSIDWSWNESEEAWSRKDTAIQAVLSISHRLLQNHLRTKCKNIDQLLKIETLLAGLKWHKPMIRLLSAKILLLLHQNPHLLCSLSASIETSKELSEFLLSNCESMNDDLHQFVISSLSEIEWTEDDLNEWSLILGSSLSREESLLSSLQVIQSTQSSFLINQSLLITLLFDEAHSVRTKAFDLLNQKDSSFLLPIIKEAVILYGPADGITIDLVSKMIEIDDHYLETFIKEFKPSELDETNLILSCEKPSKVIDLRQSTQYILRIDQLLRLSGSSSINECPQFSHLSTNLEEHGISSFTFAHLILNYQRLLSRCINQSKDEEFKTQITYKIWESILRTRHKTVVDLGTELLPIVFKEIGEKETYQIFRKTIDLVLSSQAKTRTLTLSKTLWSSCRLYNQFFHQLLREIKDILECSLDPTIITRSLKILKYFLAREQCPWSSSPDTLCHLFRKTLQIYDENTDFLAKSAATILFGFLANLIVNRKPTRYYFELFTERWDPITKIIFQTFNGKKKYGKEYKMLVLAFLSKFRLGSRILYSKWQLWLCEKLVTILLDHLNLTMDIRESRSILDCLASLIPYNQVSHLLGNFIDRIGDNIDKAQQKYFYYSLKNMWGPNLFSLYPSKSKLPTDVMNLPYIRQIQQILDSKYNFDFSKAQELLELTNFQPDWELSGNTLGYSVAISSKLLLEKECSSNFMAIWKKAAFKALSIPGSSAEIAARSVVEMGLSPFQVQPELAKKILIQYFQADKS